MAMHSPSSSNDKIFDVDFERINCAFISCQSDKERTNLARTECSQILTEGSRVDLKAFHLTNLIEKYCRDISAILLPSDLQELQKLSNNAKNQRVTPLKNISKAWGTEVVVRFGLATESYNLLRYASTASKTEPDWQKARIKLNQIISVKGPWRLGTGPAPIKLQKLHFEYLSKWPGEGDFKWNSQPPMHLEYRKVSPLYCFDEDGFVILSQPLYPLASPTQCLPQTNSIDCESTVLSESLSASLTPTRAPNELGQQTGIDKWNLAAEVFGRAEPKVVPEVRKERSEHRLRSSLGAASHKKQANKQGKRNDRQQQPRVRSLRHLRQAGTWPVLRTRKQDARKGQTRVRKSCTTRRHEKPEKQKPVALDQLLLADDCVTETLLDDTFKTRKYNSSFQPTASVRISLRFVNHDCNPNAELKAEGDCTVVVARRNIAKDEEITVQNSTKHVSKANRDCSCATCQSSDRFISSKPHRVWPQRGLTANSIPPKPSINTSESLKRSRFHKEPASQNTTIQQLRLIPRYEGLNAPLQDLFGLPHESNLWETAYAWQCAIKKAGGLDGPRAPKKFRAHDVWKRRPSDHILFAHILDAFTLSTSNVYVSFQPNEPVDGSKFAVVLQQLYEPNTEGAYYAINIPLAPEIAEFALPNSLHQQHPCLDGSKLTVNITPKYTFVDIHIGGAMGCCKLWATWPGSEHNRNLLHDNDHVDQKFLALWDRLEDASFTLTDPDDVINLEPGDLHATVTLKGGLTPGIEYCSAKSVPMTYEIWREERANPIEFLHSCSVGLRFPDSRLSTAQILCSALKEYTELFQYHELKSLILTEEKEGRLCLSCGEAWEIH